MAKTANKTFDEWKIALANNPFGPKISDLHLNDGDIVFVIDVSGSMQSNIDFLKKTLNELKDMLIILGIDKKIHLVVYSDYDTGSFITFKKDDTKKVVPTRTNTLPDWFERAIVPAGFAELNRATQEQVKTLAKNSTDVFTFMANLKLPAESAYIKDMFGLAVEAYIETENCNGAPAPDEVNNIYHDKKVFRVSASGIDNIITALGKTIPGTTLDGSGGDFDEAGMTTALAIAAAAINVGQGDAKVNIIFFSDAPFHMRNGTETQREKDTLNKLGLPSDIDNVFQFLKHLGHQVFFNMPSNIYYNGYNATATPNINHPNSFLSMVIKHDNCFCITHKEILRNINVFMAVLLNIFSILMSGTKQTPWILSSDEKAAIRTRIGGTDIAVMTKVDTMMLTYKNMVIHMPKETVDVTIPMPKIDTHDKETNQKINKAYLNIMKNDPLLMCFMKFLSYLFYRAKSTVSETDNKTFTDFMSKMAKDKPDMYAVVNALFVESRLNNRDELEEVLQKFYDDIVPAKLNDTSKVIVFNGEPLPRDTFMNMSRYFNDEMLNSLKNAMKSFKIVTLAEATHQGINTDPSLPFADRKYLPLQILGQNANYLHLVWALALNNETMPPRGVAFKIAVIIVAQGTGLDVIPHLRLAAANFVRANYMKYLAMFTDDKYEIPIDRNPLEVNSWWFQPLILRLLIKVLQTIQTDESIVQRIELAYRIITATKPMNDQVSFSLSKSKIDWAKSCRLMVCPSGDWMPETLFIPNKGKPHRPTTDPYACPANVSCVYCEGTHGDYTDEGRDNRFCQTAYHADDSPEIQPSPELRIRGIMNVCMDNDMDTLCSTCACHYSVVDGPQDLPDGTKRGRGANAPKCYNCRKVSPAERARRQANPAPIRTCIKCMGRWVFGTPNDNWTCVYCEHGANLGKQTTYTAEISATIWQILRVNPSLMDKYASNYGLSTTVMNAIIRMEYEHSNDKNSPRFHKDPTRFIGMMRLPVDKTMIDVKQYDIDSYEPIKYPSGCKFTQTSVGWQYNSHTSDDCVFEITNMAQIINTIANIKKQRLRDSCDLGLCGVDSHALIDLVNLCGHCTFKGCKFCVRSMTQNRPGTLIPVARLTCPCGRAMCQDTMDKIGRGDQVILKEAAKAVAKGDTSNRIALCCGAHYVDKAYGEETGRIIVTCYGQRVRNLPPFNGACGVDNPDDDTTDYRCPTCLEAEELYNTKILDEIRKQEEEADAHDERIRTAFTETQNDIDIIKQSYPTGTILRRCPKCKVPTTFTYGCAHITCGNPRCKTHWCWLCGTDCATTNATYRHMNEREHARDRYHRDCYNVSAVMELADVTNASEIIKC